MTMTKRFMMGATVAAAMTIGGAAHAQSYPTRPITVIIPFAGGSASDVVSRIMFDKMSQSLGQPIVVENKPGAGGNSGTALAAKATPDGYTLVGAGSGPIAANLDALQEPRLRPAEGTGHHLAVRQLHHRGDGEQQARHQDAQGADRARQEGARRAQLRLGRHRLVAASGRRIFRAGHRREDHPRALSQHRAIRARPDLRTGPARLPVVSERRRPDQRERRDRARRRRRRAACARCPTRRPPRRPACRNTRSTAGSRWPRPPACPRRSWSGSTRS